MCKHEKAEKGLTMLCVTQSFTHGKISHTGGRNNKTWCLWVCHTHDQWNHKFFLQELP